MKKHVLRKIKNKFKKKNVKKGMIVFIIGTIFSVFCLVGFLHDYEAVTDENTTKIVGTIQKISFVDGGKRTPKIYLTVNQENCYFLWNHRYGSISEFRDTIQEGDEVVLLIKKDVQVMRLFHYGRKMVVSLSAEDTTIFDSNTTNEMLAASRRIIWGAFAVLYALFLLECYVIIRF